MTRDAHAFAHPLTLLLCLSLVACGPNRRQGGGGGGGGGQGQPGGVEGEGEAGNAGGRGGAAEGAEGEGEGEAGEGQAGEGEGAEGEGGEGEGGQGEGGEGEGGEGEGGEGEGGEGEGGEGEGGQGEVDLCTSLGWTPQPFREGTGPVQGDIAGDFTVTTLDGAWTLSDHFTGCESYIFLAHFPDLRGGSPADPWMGDTLWDTPIDELLLKGPDNAHYFFVSADSDTPARRQRIGAMQDRFEATLAQWDGTDAERARWRERFHFVTDRLQEIDGSPGEYANSYMDFLFSNEGMVDLGDRGRAQTPLPFIFGIDRDQRFDPGGSLNPVVGQPPELGMGAYLGHFFDHKARLRDRVAGEEATVVSVLEETVTQRVLDRDVVLPDAAAMAAFDTMEFDINVTCNHRNTYACSEWDRIARIEHCANPELEDNACGERTEVVRWITPYWRRGHRRWIIDASPFLSKVAAGGAQTFRVELGPSWERATERDVDISVRLSTRGGARSMGVVKAYGGGAFDADYNERHAPFTFTPDADAQRVELVSVISGHGQADGTNCSEWCDHRHRFTVNGDALPEIRSDIAIGGLRACAEKANAGVSPGQGGNWAPGRAFWCPGMPVDAIRQDITDLVNLGVENELTYSANLAGRAPGGGNIELSTHVVWYTE